jgi:hypothetical protein
MHKNMILISILILILIFILIPILERKSLVISMGYNIEVAIDVNKHPNLSETKKFVTDMALEMNCDHYYYIFDYQGNCKQVRNHCIIVINYDDQYLFDCSKLMKKLKKIPDLHIECIYEDSIVCKLIYASKYYLSTMERENVVKYNQFKRERGFSDNENMLLNQL